MVKTINEYIRQFPAEQQPGLYEMLEIIKGAVPTGTTEKISWNMPTFYLYGNLVHFAGFKKHIGFFMGSDGMEMFKDQLNGYKYSKGGFQIPYEKPLPKQLIKKIVKYRVRENTEKHKQ